VEAMHHQKFIKDWFTASDMLTCRQWHQLCHNTEYSCPVRPRSSHTNMVDSQ